MVLTERAEGGLEVVKPQLEASREGGCRLISGSKQCVWDSTCIPFTF